ncbi:hypothetical protein [Flavobacterium sp.]
MNFEDLLKKNYKPYRKADGQTFYPDSNYRPQSSSRNEDRFNPVLLFSSLRNSRKLKIVILIVLLALLAIIIGIIALLYPLFRSIIDYIADNGLRGLFDEILSSLDTIWNGTKK